MASRLDPGSPARPAGSRGPAAGRADGRRGLAARPPGRGGRRLRDGRSGTPGRRAPAGAHANPSTSAGELEGVRLPHHYDFTHLRATPAELRAEFARLGWRKVIAFQTRNPMHRAHFELTLRAAREAEANLLIHPVVGLTKPGDVDHYLRVRCYEALLHRYPPHTVRLALLPLAMRMAGPREALWHALIRKNYGCTHFIVGRDHAGPGRGRTGRPSTTPTPRRSSCAPTRRSSASRWCPSGTWSTSRRWTRTCPRTRCPTGRRVLSLSGTELRRRLTEGREIPSWFTFPEVAAELRRSHPPAARAGVHGLLHRASPAPGSRRSPTSCWSRFLEMGGRPVTLLDGDIVRKHLSSELGFSKEDRDINIRRIGFVAVRDHEERRHRPLRADRPVRLGPQGGAGDDRAARRLHPGPRRRSARGLRAARPQGALRQGAGGPDRGVHGRLGPLRASPGRATWS